MLKAMKNIPKIITNPTTSSITLTSGSKEPKYSLIWLHGLGDTSSGFMSFWTHSASPLYSTNLKITMLQAPTIKVAVNHNMPCPSWYNMYSLNRFTAPQEQVFDFADIQNTQNTLKEQVQQEVKFWKQIDPQSHINPYHRVYVGGFSQGGVMALKYAMEASQPPAGVISMSGYMLKATGEQNMGKVPTCLMHGEQDDVIKEIQAKNSYDRLFEKAPGITEYHKIKKIGHSVRLEQLGMLRTWFNDTNRIIDLHYKGKLKQQGP